MTTPLRQGTPATDGAGPESPEALMISALLEDGIFDASRYRVSEEDLACFEPLWSWCQSHQDQVGRAPGIELVKARFPEFTLVPDVDPYWAAHQLRQAAAERKMRTTIQSALELLGGEDIDSAYALFSNLQPPAGMHKSPVTLFDPDTLDIELGGARIPVPFDLLGRATGGIGAGETWTVGARTGHGKTNVACGAYLPHAIKNGWSCAYFSIEMPAQEIAQMVRRGMAHNNKELLAMLDSPDKNRRTVALQALEATTPGNGSLSVFDPSHNKITVELIRDALSLYDLVVIDHFGLMQTKSGKRASDEWRIAAEISNRLHEEVLRYRGRLLLLSQINRAGESMSPLRTPKISELAGTDSIGQDSDVVVTMQRFSESVLVHDAVKVRRGPGVRFFTEFEPAKPSFLEISKMQAEAMARVDEDRNANMFR